jgi:hypothetical protein
MRARLAALALAALVLAGCARSYDYDPEAEEKPRWKEVDSPLPAYPAKNNLVQVDLGGATPGQFYVDRTSFSVGPDGVVRYTALLRASGGATNVTFEGMRCETRERKLYALGHPDGTWVRTRDPQWERIQNRERMPYYYVLFNDYFCPMRTQPTPPKQAVDALERGVGLSPNYRRAD